MQMPARRRLLTLCPFLLLALGAAAQQSAGELIDIRGGVSVDAFATGRFITARENKRVYPASVVRLEAGATAVLLIDQDRISLTAGANEVATHLAVREKRQSVGWFKALRRVFFPGSDQAQLGTVALGTRAAEPEVDTAFDFFDDADTLAAAREHLAQSDFGQALVELQALLDPDLAEAGLVAYVSGAAYFGLHNYAAASAALAVAREQLATASHPDLPDFGPQLLLQLGYSSYLIGASETARGAAEQLWQLPAENEEREHALLLLLQLDIDAGEYAAACTRASRGGSAVISDSLRSAVPVLLAAAGCPQG